MPDPDQPIPPPEPAPPEPVAPPDPEPAPPEPAPTAQVSVESRLAALEAAVGRLDGNFQPAHLE